LTFAPVRKIFVFSFAPLKELSKLKSKTYLRHVFLPLYEASRVKYYSKFLHFIVRKINTPSVPKYKQKLVNKS